MKRAKRWLVVVGLWWASSGSVSAGPTPTSSVKPPPASPAAVASASGGALATAASSASAAEISATPPAVVPPGPTADATVGPGGTTPAISPGTSRAPAAQASVAAMPTAGTAPAPAAAVIAGGSPAASPTASPATAGVRTAALTVGAADHRRDDTALGQRLFREAVDGARLNPLNWAVHVYKGQHRIELYYRNQLFKTYHAVFGRGGLIGGKEWEGDSRTPEGAYLIIAKHPSERFRWFLKLNYPNARDQERFATLRASHRIPRNRREGSLVGIHGTDSPILNIEDVNWTLGCISVDNSDVSEMAALLPVGTLVVINP